MYDENSFKNYIFWLQVKRVFLMIVFSVVGAFLGILLSQFLIDVLLILNSAFKVVIIAVSTLLFFGISLLLTAGTGKEVQDGYWKMAVLRKLTVISKKLDYLEGLNDNPTPEKKEIVKKVTSEIKKEITKNDLNEPEMEQLSIDDDIDIIKENKISNIEETKESPKQDQSLQKTGTKAIAKTNKNNSNKTKPNTKRITNIAKKKASKK